MSEVIGALFYVLVIVVTAAYVMYELGRGGRR